MGSGRDYLELYFESDNTEELDSPDNLTITPWGDLWLAEDGDGIQRVMRVTAEGDTDEFARNRLVGVGDDGTSSEFCGPTFSPDGRTFFLTIQNPGHTFAIWGPFPRPCRAAVRELSRARPRMPGAPRIDEETRDLADEHDLSVYGCGPTRPSGSTSRVTHLAPPPRHWRARRRRRSILARSPCRR